MVNMNEKYAMIFVDTIPYGKTKIEVKVSRRIYNVEFDKSLNCTSVSIWRKSTDKKTLSENLCIKNDSRLDKDFFENIISISNAQHLCNRYLYALYFN